MGGRKQLRRFTQPEPGSSEAGARGYLPQHFIEDLCNEIEAGNETEFGKELRKVIFSRVPEEKQLIPHAAMSETSSNC